MKIEDLLVSLAREIAAESADNPAFRSRLEAILSCNKPDTVVASDKGAGTNKKGASVAQRDATKRKGGRRAPAVVDPVELAAQGESYLRETLSHLELSLLHDIVAQYGMDPGKLVMKWRDRQRIIDRIVEISKTRAVKGDAFRKE